MSEYVIEMLNITKRFPGIVANDNITLQLKKGEIHALLGENGAGKSTLMSVLFGLYQPEEGEILVNGKKAEISAQDISEALYTHGQPDVDLLVRTGGEQRISNFLLWQSAYAELYFTDTLWPDFKEKDLDQALTFFAHRQRRFGAAE